MLCSLILKKKSFTRCHYLNVSTVLLKLYEVNAFCRINVKKLHLSTKVQSVIPSRIFFQSLWKRFENKLCKTDFTENLHSTVIMKDFFNMHLSEWSNVKTFKSFIGHTPIITTSGNMTIYKRSLFLNPNVDFRSYMLFVRAASSQTNVWASRFSRNHISSLLRIIQAVKRLTLFV